MSYSLVKVREDGSSENVRRDETKREEGQEVYTTVSRVTAIDEAWFVKQHMDEEFKSVVVLKDGH